MDASQFHPVPSFCLEVNRSERTQQVRLLVPLLANPTGRAWFLQRLGAPCTEGEARAAQVYQFVFPLRDLFTWDYYECQGKPHLERGFIAYYNVLFGLPEDFGVDDVWLTGPGGKLRHPAAGGSRGWHDGFLRQRVPDADLYQKARDVRRMLRTEADALLLTDRHAMLVECKYLGRPATEQYTRHQMMGERLARRLGKAFHFGMVVQHERDPGWVRLDVPYVTWHDIEAKLQEW